MFLQPASLNAAIDLLTQHQGRLLAGGTDLFPGINVVPENRPIIDISRVPELSVISTEADHIRLGAGATWSEIVAAPLPAGLEALKAAAREIGSIQIQNRGTIGGNLCNASPAADSVPPLLTLDAQVEIAAPSRRRDMPLGDFILGNRRTALAADEILSAVLIPRRQAERLTSHFVKLGARRYLVISIAMIAVALERSADGAISTARVAIGSCSAVAQRLPQIEQALIGARSVTDIAVAVTPVRLASLSPIDDVRATADYRRDAAATLIRRAVQDCFVKCGEA
ncbi:FAD binding domain-containing protein [Dongia rigui]|uniref:FAD binding domain-containing protein n=1 Tax=Dongia rigui TaxID=940149 RepID=A0ABU5E060_9PROT|nr:FAD binding domain-containing protein [Dongia rigui]MDY0872599.1 FAD binding domain-containing protein [Dongia rigui]